MRPGSPSPSSSTQQLKLPRVLCIQPVLPAYRKPFFEALGRELELWVWADQRDKGSLKSASLSDSEQTSFTFRSEREGSCGPFLYHRGFLKALLHPWPELLLLPWNTRYLELFFLLPLARLCRKRTVLWGHGYSKQESRSRAYLRRLLGRMADACVVYSEPIRQQLLETTWSSTGLFAANNALARRPIELALEQARSLPSQVAQLEPYFLFCSRLEADNRLELAIEALALLRKTHSCSLVIVGDGPARPALEELSWSLGLSQSVLFMGAIYEEERLAPLFLAAQAFVYPANIGLSILHAFHYGLPVITSADRSRQNPEIAALRDGIEGWTYPDGQVTALAAAMERMLMPDERERMGQAALRRVTAQDGFSLENMVNQMVAALRFASAPTRSDRASAATRSNDGT